MNKLTEKELLQQVVNIINELDNEVNKTDIYKNGGIRHNSPNKHSYKRKFERLIEVIVELASEYKPTYIDEYILINIKEVRDEDVRCVTAHNKTKEDGSILIDYMKKATWNIKFTIKSILEKAGEIE